MGLLPPLPPANRRSQTGYTVLDLPRVTAIELEDDDLVMMSLVREDEAASVSITLGELRKYFLGNCKPPIPPETTYGYYTKDLWNKKLESASKKNVGE